MTERPFDVWSFDFPGKGLHPVVLFPTRTIVRGGRSSTSSIARPRGRPGRRIPLK